jgi:hypothetical protein
MMNDIVSFGLWALSVFLISQKDRFSGLGQSCCYGPFGKGVGLSGGTGVAVAVCKSGLLNDNCLHGKRWMSHPG